MNSVVSPKTTVAPRSTKRSATRPMTQLDAMPLVVSEAPHLMDMMTFSMPASTRCCAEMASTSSRASSMPRAMAGAVPPSSWMAILRTGLPVCASSSYIRSWSVPSHPRVTMRTAPTLGLFPREMSVSVTRSRSGGSWQHPWWWR